MNFLKNTIPVKSELTFSFARKGRTKASPHCHLSAWEGNQFLLLWDAEVYETPLGRITKVLSTEAHKQDLI